MSGVCDAGVHVTRVGWLALTGVGQGDDGDLVGGRDACVHVSGVDGSALTGIRQGDDRVLAGIHRSAALQGGGGGIAAGVLFHIRSTGTAVPVSSFQIALRYLMQRGFRRCVFACGEKYEQWTGPARLSAVSYYISYTTRPALRRVPALTDGASGPLADGGARLQGRSVHKLVFLFYPHGSLG